jgi:hypothetical protein
MQLKRNDNSSMYIFFIAFGIISVTFAIAARILYPYGIGFSCMFKRIFKIPCLTCGTSRVFYHLGSLEFSEAFLSNPMIDTLVMCSAILMIIAGVSLLLRLPKYEIMLSREEKAYVTGAAIALLIANWIYLIIAKI